MYVNYLFYVYTSLLVNIWLNHTPSDAILLPEKLVKQVSKTRIPLDMSNTSISLPHVIKVSNKVEGGLDHMKWQFGDENIHSIDMLVPRSFLRNVKVDNDIYKLEYAPGCHVNVA